MHAHAGHAHAHGTGARSAADRRALGAALALVLGFAGVEAVGGLVADSLALLADAAHMLSDSFSLALALGASWLAGRPATPECAAGRPRSLDRRRGGAAAGLAG